MANKPRHHLPGFPSISPTKAFVKRQWKQLQFILLRHAKPFTIAVGIIGFGYLGSVRLDEAAIQNEARAAVRTTSAAFMDHNYAGIKFLAPSEFFVTSDRGDGPCDFVTARRVVLDRRGTHPVTEDEDSSFFGVTSILRPNDFVQTVGACETPLPPVAKPASPSAG